MFAIIIGLIVIALVVTLLLKGYYPQAILFMGGVVLLTCTAIFACKSSKDHSKPRNEVDTSLKSPV